MPSSKPNILNASSIQELLDQLNFVINDIYSQIDIARGLDNQGEIIPLSRGGLEKDVSGYAGLVQITGGAAVEINASNTIPGTYLPAMSATARGGVPATGTPSGKFLKDSGSFDTLPTPTDTVRGGVLQQTHIVDAKEDYAAGDLDSEAEIITAINSANGKLNDLLAALEAAGVIHA